MDTPISVHREHNHRKTSQPAGVEKCECETRTAPARRRESYEKATFGGTGSRRQTRSIISIAFCTTAVEARGKAIRDDYANNKGTEGRREDKGNGRQGGGPSEMDFEGNDSEGMRAELP